MDPLLIDVDGPLTDSFAVVSCEVFRDLGYAEAYPDALTQWDYCTCFNVSSSDKKLYYAEMAKPGIAQGYLVRPGAEEFLAWARSQYRVVALTAPLDSSQTWCYDRTKWLVDKLDFSKKDIVFARDKTLVSGILIDDKPEHIEGRATSYLWDTTYNKGVLNSQRVTSFSHLKHRLEVFNAFSRR